MRRAHWANGEEQREEREMQRRARGEREERHEAGAETVSAIPAHARTIAGGAKAALPDFPGSAGWRARATRADGHAKNRDMNAVPTSIVALELLMFAGMVLVPPAAGIGALAYWLIGKTANPSTIAWGLAGAALLLPVLAVPVVVRGDSAGGVVLLLIAAGPSLGLAGAAIALARGHRGGPASRPSSARAAPRRPLDPIAAARLLRRGLPREGPGSEALTLEALRRLGRLPRNPRVVDVGCGTVRSTLVLARFLGSGARITAVDVHASHLQSLLAAARQDGREGCIDARSGPLDGLSEAAGSVDLLWSEGAAQQLGLERAFAAWRPLMAPGGRAAVSELTWLVDDPPAEAREHWSLVRSCMGTVTQNAALARAAGWELIDTFTYPPEAWWDEYYRPLVERMAALRPSAEDEPALRNAMDEAEREIALYDRYSERYGYVFYLLAAAEGLGDDHR